MFNIVLADFISELGLEWVPDEKYEKDFNLILNLNPGGLKDKHDRVNSIYTGILSKFELQKQIVKDLLSQLAKRKVLLNYHEKNELRDIVDSRAKDDLEKFLKSFDLDKVSTLSRSIEFMSDKDILRSLKKSILESNKEQEILEALFSYYLFNSFQLDLVLKSQSNEIEFTERYFDYLQSIKNNALKRNLSLAIVEVNPELVESFGNEKQLLSYLNTLTKEYYQRLDNHCFFGIYYNQCSPWSAISNNILYAEKHLEEPLVKGYFHPNKIENETVQHNVGIDENAAKFEIANSGFTYKDTYIIEDVDSNSTYDSLVLFEKNKRDETVIPCPACRSSNVRGNSYPVLGVRSWECYNNICPDKSKFNRGKRYSLSSIIRQEAILDKRNLIPVKKIGDWRLDKVSNKSKEELIEFVINTYSLFGDNVEVVNGTESKQTKYGRQLTFIPHNIKVDSAIDSFYDSCYFKRYIIENKTSSKQAYKSKTENGLHFINGNSESVLKSFDEDFFDGAVTSPPYYNAREYSQWPNIYCYLYDMYNNAKEVYRCLKPGGVYLYNIFDYFDNERNVVFSAMGKKRMILGPYIVNMFERLGFKIEKNIIWYKGHIQGNRSFNQGNFVPYYQAPLNCYEHILVFRKPGEALEHNPLPNILDAKPVHKMVRGENVLGHTAPFPYAIPNLLYDSLRSGSRILDPYAGSFTTLRARGKREFEVYGIEMNQEYFDLGIKLSKEDKLNVKF